MTPEDYWIWDRVAQRFDWMYDRHCRKAGVRPRERLPAGDVLLRAAWQADVRDAQIMMAAREADTNWKCIECSPFTVYGPRFDIGGSAHRERARQLRARKTGAVVGG